MYQIKRIKDATEITSCVRFDVDNYQWQNTRKPKMYGWAGYIEGQGIYIKMITEESDPKRDCVTYHDKVCFDSGMEAFFAFLEDGEPLSDDVMYTNFEVNANGMLFSTFGKGRKGRTFISDELYEKCNCKSEISEDQWSTEFLVPIDFLTSICAWDKYLNGEAFYCNFYKISEKPEIEHYGSYKKIDSETPNFHKPSSFDTVVISD